jgi:hypothetical protein
MTGVHGLSCYTTGLFAYLAGEWDAAALLSRSVGLAIRVDLPDGRLVFSHHRPALDQLPDGSWLSWSTARSPAAVLPGLTGELARHGRVIAVVDAARLPWSAAGEPPAPHWLLVDGREGRRWHVTDGFTALLPGGTRLPWCGWLTSAQLCAVMDVRARWRPEQDVRNTMAFGEPVPVPPGTCFWLSRSPGRPPTSASEGTWIRGETESLRFLRDRLPGDDAALGYHLDDLWAAAGHHGFAYRQRLAVEPDDAQRRSLARAIARWDDLPRLLRIAVISAQRGRPRPSLVRSGLDEVLQAEEEMR